MKLNRWKKETLHEHFTRLNQWLPWFAWRPVRVSKEGGFRWLETVERKLIGYSETGCDWNYRAREQL